MSSDLNTVLRFRACERHLHWAMAIPFKVCYLTALILVLVYNPVPSRPLRACSRGLTACRASAWPCCRSPRSCWHRRDFALHLDNVRRAWTWRLDDFKWLALMGPAMRQLDGSRCRIRASSTRPRRSTSWC